MRKALLVFVIISFAACSHSRQIQRRSNMMSYLYPNKGVMTPPQTGQTRLQLPLRIGIAFVPAEGSSPGPYGVSISLMPPNAEKDLLDVVKKAFTGRDWVSQIVVVPSAYLQPRGGFENLQQIGRLMNVDVIALVSVDQLQTSDPRRLSFLYASIVGAYLLPLDKNETRTLIDAAVFHVPSRTFLLRAPGTSTIKGMSAAVDVEATLRERSIRGLKAAMTDLATNLNAEVDGFKTAIATGERTDVDIYTAKGEAVSRGGGGDFRTVELLLAALLAIAAAVSARRS